LGNWSNGKWNREVSSIPDANTVFVGQEIRYRDRERREIEETEKEERTQQTEIEETPR
jgi:hypothetical protein